MREISNDNYEDDMRQIREKNSTEHVPHQQVQADIIYYFTVSSILHDAGSPALGIRGMGAFPPVVTTYFSTSEELVLQHRNAEVQRILVGRPGGSFVDRINQNTIRWRWGMGFSQTFSITNIENRTRPSFVSPTLGIDQVGSVNRAF